MMVSGANFPPIIAWKVSNTLGSFSFSRSNFSLVWAVGRSFGPVREGLRRSRPPRVSQLWMKQLVSTQSHWADIFIVRRIGPDGRKCSTMITTATCSTWRGMGSVRLYFARDLPCDENIQPYHTGSVAARVNKDHAFRCTPGRRCEVCYWCIIEDPEEETTSPSALGTQGH